MVRHVAEGCSWEQFFPYYVQAYGLALDKARQRSSQPAGGSTTLTRVLAATMSTTPNLHSFTALTSLPPAHRPPCVSWPTTSGGAGTPNATICSRPSTKKNGNAATTIPSPRWKKPPGHG